jgi:hypothetical protein
LLVAVARRLKNDVGDESEDVISLELQALCHARRFDEARSLAAHHPRIRIQVEQPGGMLRRILRLLIGRPLDGSEPFSVFVERRQNMSRGREHVRDDDDFSHVLRAWIPNNRQPSPNVSS